MIASDKFALVTGAGGGLGRASSIALMNAGWTVALAGGRRDALDETAKLASPGKSICIVCDVRDSASVQSLFAEIQQQFGRLDLLFNNAGSGAPAVPIED